MARRGRGEFPRYLDSFLGSIAKLDVGVRLARDTGLLGAEGWEELEALRQTAGRLAGGLARALRRSSTA